MSPSGCGKVASMLTPALLVAAYREGYFPMPDEDGATIRWYRPDQRAHIPLNGFHCSRSLARTMRRSNLKVSRSQDFKKIMLACADREETWITQEFVDAYCELHALGLAHSVEVWQESKLVGGTYGVCLGGAFFAESMFSRVRDGSKIALFFLVEHLRIQGFALLECQFLTPHLASLGATSIPHRSYMQALQIALNLTPRFLASQAATIKGE